MTKSIIIMHMSVQYILSRATYQGAPIFGGVRKAHEFLIAFLFADAFSTYPLSVFPDPDVNIVPLCVILML